ncbi:MAG: 5-(carboxyamino)imidazole ribonucleotide synthase [Pseudomonadota bacterium]
MPKRVGIIGAGQLGGYLCLAGRDLALDTVLLAENEDDIAIAHADHVIVTELAVNAQLQAFIEQCDVVTFEKEAIPTPVLECLQQAQDDGHISVAPSVATMQLLQNKAHQNQWLQDNGWPIPEFLIVQDDDTFDSIQQRLGLPFVLKAQRGGYDGYGVQIVHTAADMEVLARQPCIAERYIADRREIAVLAARNTLGETAIYPSVEMVFDPAGNILRQVVCPAHMTDTMHSDAGRIASEIVARLSGVGMFAVEMFIEGEQLWVNEISPRVHNAGHLTIEAQPVSQFEQHMRAVTGMPLGAVNPDAEAAMINLLSEPGSPVFERGGAYPSGNATAHWYGKREARPLRKMGHITAVAQPGQDAVELAQASFTELSQQSGQASG